MLIQLRNYFRQILPVYFTDSRFIQLHTFTMERFIELYFELFKYLVHAYQGMVLGHSKTLNVKHWRTKFSAHLINKADNQNSPEYERKLHVKRIPHRKKMLNGLRQWYKKAKFGIQFIHKLYMKAGKPRM